MAQTHLSEESKKAQECVYRLLNFRQRSEKELRNKLKTKRIPLKVIDQTIQHFKDLHLIDDRQFTQAWIATRLAKPLGINRIRLELKEKGIADELIKKELDFGLAGYDEYGIVNSLAQKRLAKYKTVDKDKTKQRIFGYLVRRGFNQAAIMKAINTL